GSWWLPTFRPGASIPAGPDLVAYQIAEGNRSRVVVWSPGGPRTVHLHLPAAAAVTWPVTARLGKASHHERTLQLSDEPVVVENVGPQDVFPAETLEGVLQQAKDLKAGPLGDKLTRQRLDLKIVAARNLQQTGLYMDAYVL